jgi:hypothetical protein
MQEGVIIYWYTLQAVQAKPSVKPALEQASTSMLAFAKATSSCSTSKSQVTRGLRLGPSSPLTRYNRPVRSMPKVYNTPQSSCRCLLRGLM